MCYNRTMKTLIVLGLLFCFPCVCLAPETEFSKTIIIIEQACVRFNYSVSKALSLLATENDFKNTTTFQKSTCRHYYGAGQICLETAKIPGLHFKGTEKDLENPKISIPLCVHYLKIFDKRFHHNYEKTVAHYSGYVGQPNREKHFFKVRALLRAIRSEL